MAHSIFFTMKSLLLLSLAPFVYTAVSPDPSPSQNQEGVYKCRQFKLSLTKPDGKDAHFKVSTKTLLKKLVVSKKAVLVKKSDLSKVQSLHKKEKEKSDAQANPSDVVVVEKPATSPFGKRLFSGSTATRSLSLEYTWMGKRVKKSRMEGESLRCPLLPLRPTTR